MSQKISQCRNWVISANSLNLQGCKTKILHSTQNFTPIRKWIEIVHSLKVEGCEVKIFVFLPTCLPRCILRLSLSHNDRPITNSFTNHKIHPKSKSHSKLNVDLKIKVHTSNSSFEIVFIPQAIKPQRNHPQILRYHPSQSILHIELSFDL